MSKKNLIASLCITKKLFENQNEVTDFYDKKIPKLDSNYTCLAVITLDSALKKMTIIIC